MRDSEPVDSGDFEQVAGFEALSESTLKCVKGVIWKDTPAHYFLNNIEENLLHLSVAFDWLYCVSQVQIRALNDRVEALEAATAELTT